MIDTEVIDVETINTVGPGGGRSMIDAEEIDTVDLGGGQIND